MHRALSETLCQAGDLPAALQELTIATDLEPGHAWGWARRAEVASLLNRHDEASQAAQRALQLAKPDVVFDLTVGRVALRAGRLEEARDAATRALAQHPQDAHAQWLMGGVGPRLDATL